LIAKMAIPERGLQVTFLILRTFDGFNWWFIDEHVEWYTYPSTSFNSI